MFIHSKMIARPSSEGCNPAIRRSGSKEEGIRGPGQPGLHSQVSQKPKSIILTKNNNSGSYFFFLKKEDKLDVVMHAFNTN